MSLTLPDCPKFTVSRTGLAVHQDLSFEEWSALAPRLNEASRCVAFLIGDWLIYGEARFNNGTSKLSRRVRSEDYERAVAATGLDRSTLQNYAYVARKVPSATRLEALSWEHHKAVAKLKGSDQLRWLRIVAEAGGAVSSRRLRKSITAGRLLSLAELKLDPADRGIPNHIPHINHLRAWWEDMKKARWLERATKAQRATLKRDLMPVIDIFEQL
jgi:hypothetical protein